MRESGTTSSTCSSNGTTDYPGNSLGEALREIGVELGPDINAHVGHDETGYQIAVLLDAPHKAPLVFHALAQMAGAATFEADEVESERGVVLDEMRLRPRERQRLHQLRIQPGLHPGHPL